MPTQTTINYDIWCNKKNKDLFFYKYVPESSKNEYVFRGTNPLSPSLYRDSDIRCNYITDTAKRSDLYYIYRNIPKDIINIIIRKAINDKYQDLSFDGRNTWMLAVIQYYLNDDICPELKVIF